MVTSHSWHPGTGRVSSRWPVPVSLQPDELFSTWLVRAALAQGCDPLTMTGDLWPKWRIWTVDPDRGVARNRLMVLARKSGIDVAALEASCFKDIASAVKASIANAAFLPWVLALGSRNRQRHGGLQYCAQCLMDDKAPFFRLQWRLAWHTCCAFHKVQLADCCCTCLAPVEPHRLTALQCVMSTCPSCGYDLRICPTEPANVDALAFQKAADVVVKSGYGLYGETALPTAEWFALNRYFLLLVRAAARRQSTSFSGCLAMLDANIAATLPSLTGLSFELLPVGERAAFLACTQSLLCAGPSRLHDAAHASLLSSAVLRQDLRLLPLCIQKIVDSLPTHGRSPKVKNKIQTGQPVPRKTVSRMWARLQRKMRYGS